MRSVLFLFFVGFQFILLAQTDSLSEQWSDFPHIRADSIKGVEIKPIVTDSLRKLLADTSRVTTDSLTGSTAQPGDIETTINYTSRDSIFFDLGNRKLDLYGESHIDYGSIQLDAELTSVDWEARMIHSMYVEDTTGRKIGKPIFTDNNDVYETEDIVYNFKSKRAVIKGVVTEKDGAFMHGEDVKMNEDDELFIRDARYSTCNLEDPHFFIESEKIKVIPGKQVVSGPFHLKFRTVPTPLAFPFGMFPQTKQQASGIIVPSYGEETRRGFFFRDGGYYFAINDYVDLKATGDIYSKGGYGFNINSNYRKRYKYSGNFNFSYNRSISDEIENPLETNDFWVRWSFSDQSGGPGSFNASTNFGTSTYNRNNNLVNQNFERSINSRFNSNISYRRRFQNAPFNLSTSLRHSQNVQTGIVNLTLPEMTWNMNRIYPLKGVVRSSKSPLSKLNFSHNAVFKNEVTNGPVRGLSGFNIVNDEGFGQDTLSFSSDNFGAMLDRSRMGVRHTVPVNTSITFLKNFTLNPNFSLTEFWYDKELDFTYEEELNGVRVDTVHGFSRASSWRSGASLNTIVYGTVFFKNAKNIQAIRHVMTPSLSFSYNPDFRDEKYGVYKTVQIDSTGRERTFSKYEGFVYGSPTGGESKSLSFSLQNNLEMKIRDKKDSTGVGFKKVKLFENLSFSSSYNFAADSFKLSNINTSVRTSFFNKSVTIALSGTIDPYVYDLLSETKNSRGDRIVTQRKIDRYAWNSGQGIGQLSRFNTSINLNFRGKSSDSRTSSSEPGGPGVGDRSIQDYTDYSSPFGTDEDLDHIRANPQEYVDFNVPWSFRATYSINRSKVGFQDPTITQTLTFGGTLGLTGKTQITYNSGYDLENGEFTTTRIGVSRDLHCWSLNFSWVPFGRFQSFTLIIQPKSPLLQDLKLQRRRNFFDSI